jgi:GT2 family glycosyltransferase
MPCFARNWPLPFSECNSQPGFCLGNPGLDSEKPSFQGRNRVDASLAIVIPSHNRPELLDACLTTVTAHAPPRTEIVVVDDASPGSIITAVAQRFAGVRGVRLPHRSGFCAAANSGIKATTASVVELLNDDTEVTRGWAEAALEHFQEPGVGAVAPLVLQFPRNGQRDRDPIIDSAGDRYYVGGVAAKRGHGETLGPKYLGRCRVFGASASSAFYRREALTQVGGFPEQFGAYFEDIDLAFRLRRAGYHAMFEPNSRVHHHVSSSYGKPRRELLEQQSRNEERVFWRNLPGAAMASALPRHLAVLVAKAQRRWTEGYLIPFLCGRFRVFQEIPELLQHRRRLHQLTTSSLERWDVEMRYWEQT